MISQIDETLRELVRADALAGATDVDVVLDAPTKDWAARRNAPTVNLYLYDIREDLRSRSNGWVETRTSNGVVRERPPRLFKFSYLLTAWTQRPEDEHRLLASLMRCFLKYDSLPPGSVELRGGDAKMTVGLPPPEDRAFADVWTALGGELKPSLDIVVIAPMAVGIPEEAGPPVTDGAYLNLTDTVHGGTDHMRHRHAAVQPSESAVRRLGAPVAGDDTEQVRIGKGRKPGNRKR